MSLGLRAKGPRRDFRETFGGLFIDAKCSKSLGVSGSEVHKSFRGSISRHFRGKDQRIALNEHVRTFHVEQVQMFDTFCDRLYTIE